ncbi:DNA polymerase Y family protein [Streptomyces sp. HUAS TT7]|uniref:DNA polymerase Y family protein n=1 Tax=Streptomyces sp. HUAS TT7 TaxID=3447507 RepID=UPI003F65C4C9
MILCARFHLPPMYEAALPALIALAEGLTPVVQALPPDGLLADLAGAEKYFGQDAGQLAAVLRVRALAHFGLDCAIGLAPNPMLARTAARDAGPGTTRTVLPDEVDRFLAAKPVRALDGVGRSTARTLCAYGLDTVGRLADAPPGAVQRILGARPGRDLQERARGIDRTPVVPNASARSLAAERSFPRDELDPVRHRRALLSLAEELGVRLRGAGQVCRSLDLTVRYADRSTTTRTRTLPEPSAHSPALADLAYALHAALGLQRARVRGISLRAEGLAPAERAAHQLTFDPGDERARRIEAVADRARARFGPRAIVPGTLSDAA